jgi:hypothetical protein
LARAQDVPPFCFQRSLDDGIVGIQRGQVIERVGQDVLAFDLLGREELIAILDGDLSNWLKRNLSARL